MTDDPKFEPLVLEASMDSPRIVEIADATVVVFSRSAPTPDAVNEDGALVAPIADVGVVLAVADGVGGSPSGRGASRRALEAVFAVTEDGPPDPGCGYRDAIMNAFERANTGILDLGTGAATTLAVAEIANATLRAYNVGDSELLVIGQRGKIKWRSVAQSPVGYAVQAGVLDRDEAMNHDDRHLVSNVLGQSAMRIELTTPVPLAARDTVVVGTDGLFDNVREEEVVEIVRKGPLPEAADALVALAVQRMAQASDDTPSKPDDLTFVLYRANAP